jgi:hypothetical protein
MPGLKLSNLTENLFQMKLYKIKAKQLICLLSLILLGYPMFAQFEVIGEVLQRSEYRHGYGSPIHKDSMPAIFIGSRVRLQSAYKTQNIKLFASIQDVRTFGSMQSKVNEPFLSLYEGWIQVQLDSFLQLKLGRQELNFDNSRFFGSADWLLSGRSHDFILLNFEREEIKADLGFGYNQNGEKLSGSIYTNNNYKSAQLFRGEFTTNRLFAVVMLWNEGRQYVILDTAGKVKKQGINFMQTVGIPSLKFTLGSTILSGFYYHQFGLNANGKKTDAYDCNLDIANIFKINSEKGRQLLIGIGTEIISGTNKNNLTQNQSFSLLYGTNHSLNGYMDYFFVGGRHDKSVGLIDGYFKIKLDINKKLFCLLNAHYFQSQATIENISGNKLDSYLGTELDFTAGIKLIEHFSLQAGYSQMFTSGTLKYLRNMTNISKSQNWAYLMLLYRPNGKKPFVGISY